MQEQGNLVLKDNYYHALFDKNPHAVYLFDLEGRFVLVNQSGQKVLGMSQEELVGQSFLSYIHEKDREKAWSYFHGAAQGQMVTDELTVILHGQFIELTVTKIPVFDEQKVIGVFVVTQDITKRKHLEETLLEDEKKLRTLINTMPDLVVFKDGAGRWLEVNEFGKQLFELEQVDFTGKTDTELMELTPFFAEVLCTCMHFDELAWQVHEVQRYVEIVPQRDGTEKVLDTIKVPMFYENGERKGILVMARDVTDMRIATHALQENEERYRTLVENSPVAIMVYQDYRLTFTNEAGCKLLGAGTPEEIMGRPIQEFLFEELRDIVQSKSPSLDTKENYEVSIRRLDGQEVIGQVVSIPTVFQGKPANQLVVLDITEQILAERAVLASESKFRHITENMSDLVSIVDMEGVYHYTSPSFQAVLGYDPFELDRKSVFAYLHPNDLVIAREFQKSVLQTKQSFRAEVNFRHKRGHYLRLEATCTPVVNDSGTIDQVVIAARDITERKKTEAIIHRMAYHDTLTGLPNRALFIDDLSEALQVTKKLDGHVIVMFLDLDGFKNINDALGHSTGDLLLKAVAERLRRNLHEDETIYRIGGDEFTLLLPYAKYPYAAMTVASRVMNTFSKPWMIAGRTLHITASIGIAIAPLHGGDVEILMRNADIAMYHAKEKGKNNYQIFNELLQEKMSTRISLEGALRDAIQDNQFELYYQPLVQASSGAVVGAEALIRWNRPMYGMVSPGDFIPIAEETGLIVQMGEWVLRTACLQAKAWEEHGFLPIRINVNLSSRQFQEPLFLHNLKTILEETGVLPAQIGLEITESLIMSDVEYAIRTLQELRAMGFLVSIDDFGTGYSSLGYLKQFPVDKLKIDQTFVRDLTNSPEDEAIINTILALAKNLGLSVVAEGVETEVQLETLREKDCDEVQGYYFSKPLPVNDFEAKYLAEQKTVL